MKPVGLAIGDLPPLSVPIRFYLTAPLFGVLAGLVFVRDGELAFASRWVPGMLAATHLLTLGFMAMVMVGSLFQVVPVLGGGGFPRAPAVARVVHAALTAGALCLAAGLDRFAPGLLAAAGGLLGLAFAVFLPLFAWRVLPRRRRGDAMFTIRLVALALLVTVALGLAMTLGIVRPDVGIPFRTLTDSHARFGFGGWVMLLVMGVSYQVVPMFHVTPPFDTRLVKAVGLAVLGGLVLLAVAGAPAIRITAATLVAMAGLAYALAASRLLMRRRRRRRGDPSVRAWQVAFVCLSAALVLGWKMLCLPTVRCFGLAPHQEELLLGVVFGLGFAVTVILGMLGKILPFLSFTHLQRRCLRKPAAMRLLPTMDHIVTDRAARWQLGLHLAALAGVVLAVVEPACARPAGFVLCASFALCFRNVATAALRYRRAARAIAAVPDPGQPEVRGAVVP